ncbi:MAG: Peptidyl-prolyl cis-trans isomerase D [Candidatus Omnitrophica bacterium ADurb.Bin205]|nr:MAG: Peptidyl-prolyl cis-trans isomerase D [Candidatus Omnitrophica bacterium ADurb.Bin205]
MLKILRNKKTAKKIWIGLGLIIMPAFIFWGLGGAIGGKSEKKYAGEISGKKISNQELIESFSAVKNLLLMQYGENFRQVINDTDLESQAWQRLALAQEAKKMKIEVLDREVIEKIEGFPFFLRNGKFDNRLYNDLLRYTFRTQPRAFEEQIRQNIAISKLYGKITEGLTIDESRIREDYEKANQEFSVYYVATLADDFAKKIKPKEKELKDYFTKNQGAFKDEKSLIPEFKSIKQKVREAFIRTESLKRAENKIGQFAQELKSREFEQAARRCGLKVRETGFFKFAETINGIGVSDIFWNTARNLKAGEPSTIIRLPSGFYIIKVKDISGVDEKEYNERKIIIKESLLNQKKQEKFNKFLADTESKINR